MIASLNAARLAPLISGAEQIYVSGCAAEIPALPDLLNEIGTRATITGIFSPLANKRSYADAVLGRRCRTFFLTQELRRDILAGLVDFCPWNYAQIGDYFRRLARFDVAIVQVSPPDENGRYSLGTQVDFLPAFQHGIGKIIGVVNPFMPRTGGHTGLPGEAFDALLECDTPLVGNEADRLRADPDMDAIARRVVALVPDRATVQLGIGRLPTAVTRALSGHRDLRIHSGLVGDEILELDASGALDRGRPILTGAAIGSADLYRALDRNERFAFRDASRTHNEDEIAAIPRFFAINAALQIDLFGQVNSEAVGGRLLATPGGLPPFVRGARRSKDGASIMAVRAKGGAKRASGIVARFERPELVTLPTADVDIVVTEYGVAHLRDLPFDARAEALIAIADPEEQARLSDAWREVRSRAFG